jgi:DNA ligase (NAD+)
LDTALQYVVEPKIDGLSLALHYVDGVLVKAGTRGDGQVGEDVTANVKKHIQSIPQKITTSEKYLEVRGEVFISRGDFIELNKTRLQNGEAEFSTARNAAAGSLRRVLGDDGEKTGTDRKLQFLAYGLFAQTTKSEGVNQPEEMAETQSELLEQLTSLGFQVAKPTKVCTSPDDVVQTCLSFEQAAGSWDFDTDGAVIKVNRLAEQQALGDGTKAPKWAVAYKFTGLSVQTTIEDIIVQVGRTGA